MSPEMRGEKRRICLVAPSLQQGGLERAMSTLANYLHGQGFAVRLVALYRLPHFYRLHQEIEVIEPPLERSGVTKAEYYLRSLPYLRSAISRGQPDVVLSFGDYANGLVLFALAGRPFPVYVSDRSSPAKAFPLAVRLLRKVMYGRAAGIVAQTERAAEQKRGMVGGGANIRVIPNPLRPVQRYPEIQRRPIVLAVARHYRVKGLDRLIRAFSLLKAPGWELHIAGANGPETEALQQLVVTCGLAERVRFLGKVRDMDRLYAEAGLFVLPSRSEGFPNALCEAMAAGVPSISFDIIAGPRDIITDGVDGLLVQDGDETGLAAAMQRLIDDETLRQTMGARAVKIAERLSLDEIGQQYVDFLFPKGG